MKIKKLLPLITTATLATSILPLTTMVSCKDKDSKEKLGNLMYEYTPKHETYEKTSKGSAFETLTDYLTACRADNEIFIQDLIYTLSRGMPQYISYVSEFCEISKHDFNIDVNSVDVDVTNKKITFDATFHICYDYSKTKRQEMIWYDMYYYVWDTQTKVRFVFDFDTYSETTSSTVFYPFLKYKDYDYPKKQMTTYAGATQFGVSEIGSTIQLLEEHGYYIDIESPNKHFINTTQPSDEYHFMLPNKTYWSKLEKMDTYYNIYQQVWNLWFNEPSLQCIVLMFKYYMPSNVFVSTSSEEILPNSFDFGSYHMKDVSLNKTYAFDPDESGNTVTLCGFNKSLDSINNLANLENEEESFVDGVLTLPITDENENPISAINPYSFDGELSSYTNLGIPEEVTELVVPLSYKQIRTRAVAENGGLSEDYDYGFSKLTFNKSNTLSNMEPGAFYHLFEVNEIDFSNLNVSDYKKIAPQDSDNIWADAFSEIHLILPITSKEEAEGTVYLPKGIVEGSAEWNGWLEALNVAGLPKFVSGSAGWDFVSEQQ